MADEMMLMLNDDGVAHIYDETYDIVIHCESAEKQKEVEKRLMEMRWIPCSERLPDKPIRVQAQLDNWWIVTAYYDNAWHTVPDIGQDLKNDEVIAWMPMPEPWKGEQP